MRYKFLRFPEGKPKAVTFSYDDGVKSDIRLADIMSTHGMKCTFNLTGRSDESIGDYVLNHGHEVAVHGNTHAAEGKLRPIEGIQEVLNCRLKLENRYGRIIRGMAYPDSGITQFSNGASYESVKNYLTELDIAYARTLGGDNNSFELPCDWHRWMPTAKHKNPHILDWAEEFLNIDTSTNAYCATRIPRLFYVWGHSYEFDNDDNWDLIEEICGKLGGNDDIWYATNMEIYEYVKAYESLIYSADCALVYNPTLLEVWFDVDGVLYNIKPGETVKIK